MHEALVRARLSYDARDYPAAASAFDAVGDAQLGADDLAAYADAAWWMGRTDDCLRLNELACDALVADLRPGDAALAAFRLGVFNLSRGNEPVGMGWIGRAERLIEGAPVGRAHGFVQCFSGVDVNLMTGQPAAALPEARRIREMGERADEPDIVALALCGEGRALVQLGQVAKGLAVIDEAMVYAMSDRHTPSLTGILYCHTIAACHDVGDMERMRRWTEVAERTFAEASPGFALSWMCDVHRAQLHLFAGEWAQAEQTAMRVVRNLDENRVDYAAEAWYIVGEARRLRGDAAAEDAYAQAHSRGRDPQPGRALVQLAHGDLQGALISARTALTAVGPDPRRRAPLCAALVHIAIAAGELNDAVSAGAELENTASACPTSGFQAMAATACGAVLLAQGRPADALPVLRDACRRWDALGAVHESAAVCEQLARNYRELGDSASAAAEEARAAVAYERLGLRPTAPLPGGLSQRECEVLALVVQGYANREIAETLSISDRTVARHLTNIYNKIGVSSRTQAMRFALKYAIGSR